MTELWAGDGEHVREVTLEDVRVDLERFMQNPSRRPGGEHVTGDVPDATVGRIWEASGLFNDLFGGCCSPR